MGSFLLYQPFNGQLGDILIDKLESENFLSVNISVAFAKNSGVLRLKEALSSFRSAGGKIKVFVGIDLDGTSYEALKNLYTLSNDLYVVHTKSCQTFHSKIYNFIGSESSITIVGSNNLTAGGLWTNFESSIIDEYRSGSRLQIEIDTLNYFNNLLNQPGICQKVTTMQWIEDALANGLIEKEGSIILKNSTRSKSNHKSKQSSFADNFPAPLPTIGKAQSSEPSNPIQNMSTSASSIPLQTTQSNNANDYAVIWFETREMTGGSRNILDLSKQSLISDGDVVGTGFETSLPQMMKGGVQYFGIDPQDTSFSKNITINLDGIDYKENTIKYPTGKNANGTWRIQLKGVSVDGQKITRETGRGFFVHKILVFERIREDYYAMSVFDESELDNFIQASQITAYNGSTSAARRIGLL